MLSFLDTRADDARFLAFAQDAQFKRDKKWGNKTLWKVGDPGRGIAFCISQDWIFSVDVDAAWRGPLAVGLAIKQSRSEVHATLGHPVYEGDSVDKFHRDLWCWFVRYSPPGRVVLVSVCPIDIDTGKREPGTPPLE